LPDYLKEFQTIEPVSISQQTQNLYNAYMNNLNEQQLVRRRIDWSLLKYPPLKGKPPFEDFQKRDIANGLNHNRFFW
jgi:hypothetical protein